MNLFIYFEIFRFIHSIFRTIHLKYNPNVLSFFMSVPFHFFSHSLNKIFIHTHTHSMFLFSISFSPCGNPHTNVFVRENEKSFLEAVIIMYFRECICVKFKNKLYLTQLVCGCKIRISFEHDYKDINFNS